ncbi:hypothetical protein [uncultured Pontibacter sp.]|uniref:phenylacetate--CoA ligase family protein n=1 Tax=uncultured Pontibacter sp. TaxID=453356 RepID=UPI002626B42B|nr:hypothetical protein [uncultured Pontibacter sp.]
MELQKKIYNLSPIWLQEFIISIYGLKIYRLRYNKAYFTRLKELKEKDYSDIEKEKSIQLEELKKLINHAINNSQFYKEFYKDVDIAQILTLDDLKKLPILEKEVLRENAASIYTIDPKIGVPSFTGGTTGKSLKVLYTKSDVQKRMAYLDAFKWRLGIDTFKAKKATFSGREFTGNNATKAKKIFWRYNWVYKQKLYSTFDLTNDNIIYYIEDLNKYKPDVINGFVSAIYDLAKFVESKGIKLTFKPKAIFTTSETLLPYQREVVEKAFNCKIYNQYASAEGAPFITECKFGNLHYNIDTGVIESFKTEYGEEVLVTSFSTYGTPLIRYRIGDKVTFKEGICKCGSCHPLVEKIEGRKVDFLLSKERGKISLSHLADVIKGMPNCIKNMQFVQNALESIDVNIVVDEQLYNAEHEKNIMGEMKFRFGDDANININIVDEIVKEASGKFALIKNNIKS